MSHNLYTIILEELFFFAITGEQMRDLPEQRLVALTYLAKELRSPVLRQRKGFMKERFNCFPFDLTHGVGSPSSNCEVKQWQNSIRVSR